jgi:hypothetical protein
MRPSVQCNQVHHPHIRSCRAHWLGRVFAGQTEVLLLFSCGAMWYLHADVLRGRVMPQALPSIVAAAALDPAPGSRVLDMCAAPGGKATMCAQLMAGTGTVVALDRTHAKVTASPPSTAMTETIGTA